MSPEHEELSEDSLFDNAVEGVEQQTPEPQVEQPAPEAEAEAKAAPETEQPEREKVDDDAPQVPSWRVREINEEKRAAQAERDALRQQLDQQQREFQRYMAQQKPPEQPKSAKPDPLLDPDGYEAYLEKRVEDRLVNERREMSLLNARDKNPQEFDEAYATAQKHVDPVLRARMQQSNNPGVTLMEWYRELKVRAEVGTDLDAYEKKVRDKLLKDADFRKSAMETWRGEASSQVNGRPNVQLAPSMNGVSRSNAAIRASQVDLPDDDLWDQTTT